MGDKKLKPLPFHESISGGGLIVTELESEDGSITIRGHFEIPRWAKLTPDNEQFLETFLRCRGMINSVEKELGISYPTAKSRLESLLANLGMAPIKEDSSKKDKSASKRAKILEQLEKGEITAAEAKRKLTGESK